MKTQLPKKYERFFKKFGQRCRELRLKNGWTQEDFQDYGFGTRHYQRIEQGLPINIVTALRIAGAFKLKISDLLKGLD